MREEREGPVRVDKAQLRTSAPIYPRKRMDYIMVCTKYKISR
jgi:hypothetical protein